MDRLTIELNRVRGWGERFSINFQGTAWPAVGAPPAEAKKLWSEARGGFFGVGGIRKANVWLRSITGSEKFCLMKKNQPGQKTPRSNLTSVDKDATLASSVLPRTLPPSEKRVKPDAIADSELDPAVEGLDPTLPVNPVRGAPGHQIKEPSVDEEDEDGRSVGEQLVEEGVKQAEQDTMDQGVRKRGL